MVSFLARIPVPLADFSFCWQGDTAFPAVCTIWWITAAFIMKESPSAFQTVFIGVTSLITEMEPVLGVKHGSHSVVTGVCSTSENLGPFCKMSIFLMTLVTGSQVLSMNKLMFWLCWYLQSCRDFYPWQNWPCLSTFHSLKPWLYKSHFCLISHSVHLEAAVRGSTRCCSEWTPALPLPSPHPCCSLISPSPSQSHEPQLVQALHPSHFRMMGRKTSLILGLSL